MHVRRGEGGALRVGLNVTRAVRGGRIVVRDGAATVREDALSLEPSGVFDHAYADLAAPGPYTVEVRDGKGRVLLAHTEGRYDVVPKAEVKTGPQPAHVFPPPAKRSEGDWVELGRHQELNGKLLEAHDVYAAALAAFPDSPELQRAAGRLAVQLKRYDEAVEPLSKAVARRSNDAEALYYLGLAHAALGETQKARFAWDQAATLPAWRAASLLQLARLAAREGSGLESCWNRLSDAVDVTIQDLTPSQGLRLVRQALAESPEMIRAGGMEVALLRRTGRVAEAKARLRALAVGRPAELVPAARGGPSRRRGRGAVGAPRRGPRAGARAGRRLHGARPLGRRPRAARAPLSLDRRRGRAGDGPAAGLPARRVLPRLLRREERAAPAGRTSPSPRASPPATSSRTVPSPSSSFAGRWRRTRRTPPPTSSSGRSSSPAGSPTRPSPSGRRRALASTRRSPSSTATSASRCSTRAARRPRRPARLRGGHGRGPHERRALPGRRPGAEPARPRARGADRRRCAGIPSRRCPRRSSSSWPSPSPRRAASPRRRRSSRGASSRARSSARTCGRSTSRWSCARPSPSRATGGRPRRRRSRRPSASRRRARLHEGRHEGLRRRARASSTTAASCRRCSGNDAAAREHWKRAAAGHDFRQTAFAYRAAQKLGEADEAEWRPRLETALAEADLYLFRGGHYPAGATCARGMLLRALGRVPEGNEALRQVFVLPDKGMPHHIARLALQEP